MRLQWLTTDSKSQRLRGFTEARSMRSNDNELMIATTAILFILAQTPKAATAFSKDLPAMVVYWRSDGLSLPYKPDQLRVAVWRDGRILWREPQNIWKKKPEWTLTKGVYYEANIGAKLARKTLDELKSKSIHKFNGWGAMSPDTSDTFEIIRDASVTTQLGLSDYLDSEKLARDARFKGGWPTWKLIRDKIAALIPRNGRRVNTPSESKLDAWTKTPPFIIRF
ncbi:MAG: hypothetical protein QOJ65_1361 [Fimbriimonadaceae bacterium]|jgi:hypothetical protein|nr:hypothetical protein [Fimbriimonadaceae bacterium]